MITDLQRSPRLHGKQSLFCLVQNEMAAKVSNAAALKCPAFKMLLLTASVPIIGGSSGSKIDLLTRHKRPCSGYGIVVLVVECLGASTVILYGVNLLWTSEVPEEEVCAFAIRLLSDCSITCTAKGPMSAHDAYELSLRIKALRAEICT